MHIAPEELLTRREFADRHRLLKTLCLGLMVALSGIGIGIILVVRYALGGKPLTGNAAMLGGIPVLTVVAAMVTLAAPIVATAISALVLSQGLTRVAMEPPAVPNPGADLETDAERLWRVYASGKFTEYAIAEGVVLFCLVLFHVNADWLLVLFSAGMLTYMLSRFPTASRVTAWYREAILKVAELRSNGTQATGPSSPG